VATNPELPSPLGQEEVSMNLAALKNPQIVHFNVFYTEGSQY
jgi:hypothetical protein